MAMFRPITHHALQREQDRLLQAGLSIADIEHQAGEFASRCKTDTALLVAKLPEQQNRHDFAASNGDAVWAIIRDGKVVTFMFRRSTQPATPNALRVRNVVIND
jgi:hypothetical protein